MRGALWHKAAAFAARAHEGSHRKDGATPYFSHVARVTITLAALMGVDDEECLAAALLHDTIEDTTTDFDDLAEHFGESIARDVAALSKDSRLPEPEREVAYDAQLERASWRAHAIKLADVYDNLSDTLAAGEGGKKVRKRVEIARRALAIARASEGRAEVARGIALVEGLIREAGSPDRA